MSEKTRICGLHHIDVGPDQECRLCVREDRALDVAFNAGVEAVCTLTDLYIYGHQCQEPSDSHCFHVRMVRGIAEKARTLKKTSRGTVPK